MNLNDVRTLVRPFMAITGWLALIGLAIMGAIQGDSGLFLPQWLVGILMAPGAVYITDRTISKNRGAS